MAKSYRKKASLAGRKRKQLGGTLPPLSPMVLSGDANTGIIAAPVGETPAVVVDLQTGGFNGAAEFAEKLYGAAGEQHAAASNSNQIATNVIVGGAGVGAMLVPATLTLGSVALGSRSGSRRSSKSRSSRSVSRGGRRSRRVKK